MEFESEGFGFYINDDASPEQQVAMRMMAFGMKHEEEFRRYLETDDKAPHEVLTLEEVGSILEDIKQAKDDVNAIFEKALADNVDDIDNDDFMEPLMHLDGMRLDLLVAKKKLETAPQESQQVH